MRGWSFFDAAAKLNGLLIGATVVLFLSSYFVRKAPVCFPEGMGETAYPFCCMILPLLIYHSVALLQFIPAHHPPQSIAHTLFTLSDNGHFGWNLLSMSLTITGNLITLLGMVSLRHCFSIMVEARQPVFTGIYSYVRHPLYLGEFIATAGVLVCKFSPANALLFALFVPCQAFRATLEERKLRAVFPEYGEYCQRTGAFVPLFGSAVLDPSGGRHE